MGESKNILQVRSARQIAVRVTLLDEDIFNHSVDKRSVGLILFDKVCEHLNILEKDYFCLSYIDNAGEKYWLNNDKKISKQLKGKNWDFKFEVKFFPADPTLLGEDLTKYQLCLQIRRDIVNGKLPCSFVTFALLGSYMAQSELGDYDPEEFDDGYGYPQDIQFSPHYDKELLSKIAELHQQHKGQTPEDAEMHFLSNAMKLALYGVELHNVLDAKSKHIQVGVCASGLIVYKDKVQINRFVWPKVLKLSYRRSKFYVKIRPREFEEFTSIIGFRLPSAKFAKRLWKICVEYHSFFRLREAELARHARFLPRFGSHFRYSGRTQFQTRQVVCDERRESPAFERVLTKRGTFSGSMQNLRKRDEDHKQLHVIHRRSFNSLTELSQSTYTEYRPESKHANTVAPIRNRPTKAHHPPVMDNNVSLARSRETLIDFVDEVQERRSKMEQIPAVATPLPTITQPNVDKKRLNKEQKHNNKLDKDNKEDYNLDADEMGRYHNGRPNRLHNSNIKFHDSKQDNSSGDLKKSRNARIDSGAKDSVYVNASSSEESMESNVYYTIDDVSQNVRNVSKSEFIKNGKTHSKHLNKNQLPSNSQSEIHTFHYDEIHSFERPYTTVGEVGHQFISDVDTKTITDEMYSEIPNFEIRYTDRPSQPIYGRRSKKFTSNQTHDSSINTNITSSKIAADLNLDTTITSGNYIAEPKPALPVYAKVNKVKKSTQDKTPNILDEHLHDSLSTSQNIRNVNEFEMSLCPPVNNVFSDTNDVTSSNSICEQLTEEHADVNISVKLNDGGNHSKRTYVNLGMPESEHVMPLCSVKTAHRETIIDDPEIHTFDVELDNNNITLTEQKDIKKPTFKMVPSDLRQKQAVFETPKLCFSEQQHHGELEKAQTDLVQENSLSDNLELNLPSYQYDEIPPHSFERPHARIGEVEHQCISDIDMKTVPNAPNETYSEMPNFEIRYTDRPSQPIDRRRSKKFTSNQTHDSSINTSITSSKIAADLNLDTTITSGNYIAEPKPALPVYAKVNKVKKSTQDKTPNILDEHLHDSLSTNQNIRNVNKFEMSLCPPVNNVFSDTNDVISSNSICEQLTEEHADVNISVKLNDGGNHSKRTYVNLGMPEPEHVMPLCSVKTAHRETIIDDPEIHTFDVELDYNNITLTEQKDIKKPTFKMVPSDLRQKQAIFETPKLYFSEQQHHGELEKAQTDLVQENSLSDNLELNLPLYQYDEIPPHSFERRHARIGEVEHQYISDIDMKTVPNAPNETYSEMPNFEIRYTDRPSQPIDRRRSKKFTSNQTHDSSINTNITSSKIAADLNLDTTITSGNYIAEPKPALPVYAKVNKVKKSTQDKTPNILDEHLHDSLSTNQNIRNVNKFEMSLCPPVNNVFSDTNDVTSSNSICEQLTEEHADVNISVKLNDGGNHSKRTYVNLGMPESEHVMPLCSVKTAHRETIIDDPEIHTFDVEPDYNNITLTEQKDIKKPTFKMVPSDLRSEHVMPFCSVKTARRETIIDDPDIHTFDVEPDYNNITLTEKKDIKKPTFKMVPSDLRQKQAIFETPKLYFSEQQHHGELEKAQTDLVQENSLSDNLELNLPSYQYDEIPPHSFERPHARIGEVEHQCISDIDMKTVPDAPNETYSEMSNFEIRYTDRPSQPIDRRRSKKFTSNQTHDSSINTNITSSKIAADLNLDTTITSGNYIAEPKPALPVYAKVNKVKKSTQDKTPNILDEHLHDSLSTNQNIRNVNEFEMSLCPPVNNVFSDTNDVISSNSICEQLTEEHADVNISVKLNDGGNHSKRTYVNLGMPESEHVMPLCSVKTAHRETIIDDPEIHTFDVELDYNNITLTEQKDIKKPTFKMVPSDLRSEHVMPFCSVKTAHRETIIDDPEIHTFDVEPDYNNITLTEQKDIKKPTFKMVPSDLRQKQAIFETPKLSFSEQQNHGELEKVQTDLVQENSLSDNLELNLPSYQYDEIPPHSFERPHARIGEVEHQCISDIDMKTVPNAPNETYSEMSNFEIRYTDRPSQPIDGRRSKKFTSNQTHDSSINTNITSSKIAADLNLDTTITSGNYIAEPKPALPVYAKVNMVKKSTQDKTPNILDEHLHDSLSTNQNIRNVNEFEMSLCPPVNNVFSDTNDVISSNSICEQLTEEHADVNISVKLNDGGNHSKRTYVNLGMPEPEHVMPLCSVKTAQKETIIDDPEIHTFDVELDNNNITLTEQKDIKKPTFKMVPSDLRSEHVMPFCSVKTARRETIIDDPEIHTFDVELDNNNITLTEQKDIKKPTFKMVPSELRQQQAIFGTPKLCFSEQQHHGELEKAQTDLVQENSLSDNLKLNLSVMSETNIMPLSLLEKAKNLELNSKNVCVFEDLGNSLLSSLNKVRFDGSFSDRRPSFESSAVLLINDSDRHLSSNLSSECDLESVYVKQGECGQFLNSFERNADYVRNAIVSVDSNNLEHDDIKKCLFDEVCSDDKCNRDTTDEETNIDDIDMIHDLIEAEFEHNNKLSSVTNKRNDTELDGVLTTSKETRKLLEHDEKDVFNIPISKLQVETEFILLNSTKSNGVCQVKKDTLDSDQFAILMYEKEPYRRRMPTGHHEWEEEEVKSTSNVSRKTTDILMKPKSLLEDKTFYDIGRWSHLKEQKGNMDVDMVVEKSNVAAKSTENIVPSVDDRYTNYMERKDQTKSIFQEMEVEQKLSVSIDSSLFDNYITPGNNISLPDVTESTILCSDQPAINFGSNAQMKSTETLTSRSEEYCVSGNEMNDNGNNTDKLEVMNVNLINMEDKTEECVTSTSINKMSDTLTKSSVDMNLYSANQILNNSLKEFVNDDSRKHSRIPGLIHMSDLCSNRWTKGTNNVPEENRNDEISIPNSSLSFLDLKPYQPDGSNSKGMCLDYDSYPCLDNNTKETNDEFSNSSLVSDEPGLNQTDLLCQQVVWKDNVESFENKYSNTEEQCVDIDADIDIAVNNYPRYEIPECEKLAERNASFCETLSAKEKTVGGNKPMENEKNIDGNVNEIELGKIVPSKERSMVADYFNENDFCRLISSQKQICLQMEENATGASKLYINENKVSFDEKKNMDDSCKTIHGVASNIDQYMAQAELNAFGKQMMVEINGRSDEVGDRYDYYNDTTDVSQVVSRDQSTFQAKLNGFCLGKINIDERVNDLQEEEVKKIHYVSEDLSCTDSEPSETDSDSEDEIELASFEMPCMNGSNLPNFKQSLGTESIYSDNDLFGQFEIDQEQLYAVDYTGEDVKLYEMEDLNDSSICKFNFTDCDGSYSVGNNTYEHMWDSEHENYAMLFKCPEVIDDTPYTPERSILKTRSKSDSSLFDRRVHFQDNLPVYKSGSNIRMELPKTGKKETEEEKLQHIRNFLTRLLDIEPYNFKSRVDERYNQDYVEVDKANLDQITINDNAIGTDAIVHCVNNTTDNLCTTMTEDVEGQTIQDIVQPTSIQFPKHFKENTNDILERKANVIHSSNLNMLSSSEFSNNVHLVIVNSGSLECAVDYSANNNANVDMFSEIQITGNNKTWQETKNLILHSAPTTNFTISHSTPTTQSTIPHNVPTTQYTTPHSTPTTQYTIPYSAPTTQNTIPHSTPTTELTIPKSAPTTELTIPHSAQTTELTIPHCAPTTQLTLPHSAQTTELTISHIVPTTDYTITHSAPTIELTLPHSALTTELTLPRSAQTTEFTTSHRLPTTDYTIPHSTPTTELTLPHSAPTTELTLPHSAPTTELTLPHSAPTTELTLPHSAPTTQYAIPCSTPTTELTISLSALTTELTIPHSAQITELTSLHCAPTTELTLPHSTPTINLTLPHSAPTTQYAIPCSTPTTELTIPISALTAELTIPHSAQITELTSPHCAPTTELTLPHSAQATELTISHRFPTTDYTIPHSAQTTELTLPHNAPTTELTLPHSAPATQYAIPCSTPTTKLTIPHSAQTTELTIPQSAQTTELTILHSAQTTELTIPHCDPTTELTLPHSVSTTELTISHRVPTTDYTIPHSTPTIELTIPHSTPTTQYTIPHSVSTTELTLAHSAQTTGLTISHRVPTTDYTIPHSAPTTELTLPHSAPTTELTIPHSAQTTELTIPHSALTTELTIPHSTPTTQYNIQHSAPATELTISHSAPTTGLTISHRLLTTDYTIPQSTPTTDYTIPHSAPTTQYTMPNSALTTELTISHSTPTTELTITQSALSDNVFYASMLPAEQEVNKYITNGHDNISQSPDLCRKEKASKMTPAFDAFMILKPGHSYYRLVENTNHLLNHTNVYPDYVSIPQESSAHVELGNVEMVFGCSQGVIASEEQTTEDVGRATVATCNDSDIESPVIKSVTYEYVTEYKLNNVKIHYCQNRRTQTDAYLEFTDAKWKENKSVENSNLHLNISGGAIVSAYEELHGLKEMVDTKIEVEEIVEKSVCYPLAALDGLSPIHGSCMCSEYEVEETILKSVKKGPFTNSTTETSL